MTPVAGSVYDGPVGCVTIPPPDGVTPTGAIVLGVVDVLLVDGVVVVPGWVVVDVVDGVVGVVVPPANIVLGSRKVPPKTVSPGPGVNGVPVGDVTAPAGVPAGDVVA